MLHPAQRICSSAEFLYYAISSTLYQYNITTKESTQLWTASPITPAEKERNLENRAVIEFALYKEHLIWFGEDKILRVYDLQKNIELSERTLVKRACALYVDDDSIIVGDKFGDVYVYSLMPAEVSNGNAGKSTSDGLNQNGNQEAKDEEDSTQDSLPLLGHVSMLTSVLLSPRNGQRYIISADRDEHIRVSEFPKGYNIASFCLGHTQFVSALLIPSKHPDQLISGGGDEYLATWNWHSGEQISTRMLSDALASAKSEERGFAILKILEIVKYDLIAVLVEGVKRIFLYNTLDDSEMAQITIDLEIPALDMSVTGETIWITYDTEQSSSDRVAHNFDCFHITTDSASRVDLTELNDKSRTEVEKIAYTTHRADLMRKRTKAELEALRLASNQGKPMGNKKKRESTAVDKDMEKEIEADKRQTDKKIKADQQTASSI